MSEKIKWISKEDIINIKNNITEWEWEQEYMMNPFEVDENE